MLLVDGWKLYGARVCPTLYPDEQPLVFSASVLSSGISPDLNPPRPKPVRGTNERVADGASSFVMGAWVPVRGILTAVFGRAAKGSRDSTACGLLRGLGKNSHVKLCVTDRRFLIFRDSDSVLGSTPLRLAWSCPRDQIRQARVGWRVLAFGRLRITFHDGSWVVFSSTPAMGRRRATAIATALTCQVPPLPRPES